MTTRCGDDVLDHVPIEVERRVVDPPRQIQSPCDLVQPTPQHGQRGQGPGHVVSQVVTGHLTFEREHETDVAGRVGRVHGQIARVDGCDSLCVHG